MMTFEEEFPSFEKDSVLIRLGVGMVYQSEVMEKCLDKQMVKEALNHISCECGYPICSCGQIELKKIILKELGLEDDS